MSDKERLEEIKSSYLEGQHRLFGTSWVSMPKENFDWLIEQAERVQELEEENDELAERIHKLALDWSELVDENNELAERVEELELEINDWRAEVQKWQQFYEESEESHLETKELLKSIVNQNKRLREALEFYANKETYESVLISESQYDADGVCISNDEYLPPIIYLDEGETARKALEGDED